MSPRPLRHVDLYSDAGRLEGLYRDLPDPRGVAVVCHPHPLHGGTLHNKVVFRAARGLEAAGVATLRFNFRGVGASQGRHDRGEGEMRDFEAAIAWMITQHPGLKVFAGGFSFGSWVASRAACEMPEVDAIFLIGAPINGTDLRYLRRCEKPTLLIHGTKDEFGDPDKLAALVEASPRAEMVLVDGADHFFNRQLEVLEQTLRAWAEEWVEA